MNQLLAKSMREGFAPKTLPAHTSDVLRASNGTGGIDLKHMAGDQEVEQHPECCERLLHGRLGKRLANQLDVGGDKDGVHLMQLHTSHSAEAGKLGDSVCVSLAGVPVLDICGEELEESSLRPLASVGDESWEVKLVVTGRQLTRACDNDVVSDGQEGLLIRHRRSER